jgi:hypothetical protein
MSSVLLEFPGLCQGAAAAVRGTPHRLILNRLIGCVDAEPGSLSTILWARRARQGRPGWFEPPDFLEQWAGISMMSIPFLNLIL